MWAPCRPHGQAGAVPRRGGSPGVDVYALGLTLYELLTFQPAFDTSDRLALIERIKSEEPRRPRSIVPQIPRDLETIALKAIEKEPGLRYQTADAMAEDLRRFLADEPIRARQVGAAERLWRWARRHKLIAAMVLTVTVGSSVAAVYFRSLAESARPRQPEVAGG